MANQLSSTPATTSSGPKSKIHRCHLLISCEALGQASEPLARNYGWISTSSDISCGGVNGDNMLAHPVLLTAYSSVADGLQPNQMYSLFGRVISNNNDMPDHIFYEASHRIHTGSADAFPGNLIDNTGMSALGIVVERYLIREEAHGGKQTLVCIVRHTDYDPVIKALRNFLVEYRIRPVRNLERTHGLIHLGGEVDFSAFVQDWDPVNKRWIGDVYTVAPTSGNEIVTGKPGKGGATVVSTGKVQLPRRGETGHTPSHPGAGVASTSGTTAFSSNVSSASNVEPQTVIPSINPALLQTPPPPAVHGAAPSGMSSSPMSSVQDAAYLMQIQGTNSPQGPPTKKAKK